jgi:hypothetical protein
MVLQALGLERGMEKYHDIDKQLNLKQSQWKGAILNKFLLPHVQELVRQWHVAHAWCSFKTLDEDQRRQIWLDAYDADPKRMATAMFKPVIGVLDTANVFKADLEEDEERARMGAVRIMLREKYLFGCKITYTHRILSNKKVRAGCYFQTAKRANGCRMRASINGLRIPMMTLLHLLSWRLRICQSPRNFSQTTRPHRQQSGQRWFSTSRSFTWSVFADRKGEGA